MVLSQTNIKFSFIESTSTFRLDVPKDYEITKDDFIEVINQIKTTLPNSNYKVLIITTKNNSATKEALSYLLNNDHVNKYNKGEAIVSSSLMVQLSANFYGKFIAKSRNIKVFSNEIEASIWLDTLPI